MNHQAFEAASVRILFYGDYARTHLFPIPEFFTPIETKARARPVLRFTAYEFGLSLLKDVLEASVFPQISGYSGQSLLEFESGGFCYPGVHGGP